MASMALHLISRRSSSARCSVLCSESNEKDSDQGIFEMSYKLSEEVHGYIRENCPGKQLGRLTFIGHSLGGLIIRAAMPYLEKYKEKMHGLLTLCSPHLGCMYHQSKLFSTGMWVLKNWKKNAWSTLRHPQTSLRRRLCGPWWSINFSHT